MENNKKFKVIFDTNILWQNNEDKIENLFNSNISKSIEFIKENEIKDQIALAIPQLVIDERIKQTLKQVESNIQKIENSVKVLSPFGIKISQKAYKKNFKSLIYKKKKEQIKEAELEIIKTPIVSQDKIIERSLRGIKPFSDNGDRGFRDTLIWLSILNDAKKNKKLNYVFCTENIEDFDPKIIIEEFKQYSSNKLFILSNISELKEFLDKQLDLKLELKEKYEKIKEEIGKRIGDIMIGINSYKEERFGFDYSPASVHSFTAFTNLGSENLSGYNFSGINFDDIQEISKNIFELSVTVFVEGKYTENRNPSAVSYLGINKTEESFNLLIKYSTEDEKLEIQKIKKVHGNDYPKEYFDTSLYSNGYKVRY